MTKIIDGNNLLMRVLGLEGSLSGVHPLRELWLKYSLVDDLTIFVWDGYNGNDMRKAIYPEYKGNRGPKGEDTYAMVKLFKEILNHTPCMQITVPGYEADDVIFSLAKFFAASGDTVAINTNDADYLQMADLPGITLPGIRPWEWEDTLICAYKALVGDPADNIPGLPGFGDGSWKNVALYHDTIREALRDNNWGLWQTIAWPKRAERICLDKGNFDSAVMFFKVVTMVDVNLDLIAQHSKTGTGNAAQAEAILKHYMI